MSGYRCGSGPYPPLPHRRALSTAIDDVSSQRFFAYEIIQNHLSFCTQGARVSVNCSTFVTLEQDISRCLISTHSLACPTSAGEFKYLDPPSLKVKGAIWVSSAVIWL